MGNRLMLTDDMPSVFYRIKNLCLVNNENVSKDFWVDCFGADIISFHSNLKINDRSQRVICIKRKVYINLSKKTMADFKSYLKRKLPDICILYDNGVLELDLRSAVFKDESYLNLVRNGLSSLNQALSKVTEMEERVSFTDCA